MKFKTIVILELESEDVLNEKWLAQRWKNFKESPHNGFKVVGQVPEPVWVPVSEQPPVVEQELT